jgi:chemotaxis protein MotB
MVFFVLLFSLSSIDVKKMSDLQYALQSGLGILERGNQVKIEVKENEPVEEMADIHTQAEERVSESRGQSIRHFVEEAIGSMSAVTGIRVIHSDQGARIRFENAVLFDFGRAKLNPAGLIFLDQIAAVINQIPCPIRIEGHTDNVPIHTKQFPSNWELSTARAVNVVKYFVDSSNIEPQRLSAVGYGASKPLFPNDSADYRAKNRRVEIVLIEEELN